MIYQDTNEADNTSQFSNKTGNDSKSRTYAGGKPYAHMVIEGNIGKDPESFQIEQINDKGEKVYVTGVRTNIAHNVGKNNADWYSVVSWSQNTSNYLMNYIGKGDKVLIEGRPQCKYWKSQPREDNTIMSKQEIEIRVKEVRLMSKKVQRDEMYDSNRSNQYEGNAGSDRAAGAGNYEGSAGASGAAGAGDNDNNIPF